MKIWAIGDLHLSFGVANKSMDIFGPDWESHANKIGENWRRTIAPEDLVLIPGDISWAMKIDEVVPDLQWIHELPGTKVMIKGNHDYWWGSLKKITEVLPPSIHIIQNNAFLWKGIAVGGARLWDTPEYHFGSFIDFRENPKAKDKEELIQEDLSDKIFERELQRLEMSLSALDKSATMRIAMTHYPPIGSDMNPSRASEILEKHKIDVCVFGHLHNIKSGHTLFGEKRGIRYVLTSCDYLRFNPIAIA
ncbi:MAG: metallophosphoesterase [Verrucomicrobia bacterium]|nr:metallophosphoesterase [Verrucomicrobiota bacterium]